MQKFLVCIGDDFLIQVTEKPANGGGVLGVIIANKEEQIGNVNVRDVLCCSDHEMVELRILKEGNKANSGITSLGIRRADFGLFRDLLGIIIW